MDIMEFERVFGVKDVGEDGVWLDFICPGCGKRIRKYVKNGPLPITTKCKHCRAFVSFGRES